MDADVTRASTDDAQLAAASFGVDGRWPSRVLGRSESVRKTQERVLLRTRKLIDAAKDLYDDESVGSDFTVQQLVDRAGISLQTFYRYFKSKDDLLLAVHESTVQDATDHLVAAYGHLTDPVRRLNEYTVAALFNTFTSHHGSFILTTNSEQIRLSKIFAVEVARAFDPYIALLERCVRDGVSAGVMAPADSPERVASVLATLVVGLYRDLSNVALREPEAHLRAAWSFICAGLGITADTTAGSSSVASTAAAANKAPANKAPATKAPATKPPSNKAPSNMAPAIAPARARRTPKA